MEKKKITSSKSWARDIGEAMGVQGLETEETAISQLWGSADVGASKQEQSKMTARTTVMLEYHALSCYPLGMNRSTFKSQTISTKKMYGCIFIRHCDTFHNFSSCFLPWQSWTASFLCWQYMCVSGFWIFLPWCTVALPLWGASDCSERINAGTPEQNTKTRISKMV